MTTQLELHNRLAGEIVKQIIKPIFDEGGAEADVMIVLESVIVGVCLCVVKPGGDERVLDLLMERVEQRLAEIRLKDIHPEGTA